MPKTSKPKRGAWNDEVQISCLKHRSPNLMPGRQNQLVTVGSKMLPLAVQNAWFKHFEKRFQKSFFNNKLTGTTLKSKVKFWKPKLRTSKPRPDAWNIEAQTCYLKCRSPDLLSRPCSLTPPQNSKAYHIPPSKPRGPTLPLFSFESQPYFI